MKFVLASTAAAAALLLSTAANAQIVVNGGFAPNLTPRVVGGSSPFTASIPAGSVLASLNGIGTTATISQTVTLPTLSSYNVNFDLGAIAFGSPAGLPGPSFTLAALFNGTQVFSQAFSFPLTTAGFQNLGPSTYTFNTGTVFSPGPVNLQFVATRTDGNAAALQVSLDNAAVQVPGPLPILGALAAFGWSRKIRRKIKQAEVA